MQLAVGHPWRWYGPHNGMQCHSGPHILDVRRVVGHSWQWYGPHILDVRRVRHSGIAMVWAAQPNLVLSLGDLILV